MMLEFFVENWGTLLIGLAVAAVVVLVISYLSKSKKAGKSTCGSSCSHCPSAGMCHKKQ